MSIARLALLLGLVGMACGHTHQVESHEARDEASDEAKDEAKGDAAAPAEPHRLPERTHSETGTPLATSSAGLLKPGAIKTIQQRLVKVGVLSEGQENGKLDATTRSAVRQFQDAQGLPATGELDDATVEKLGLDPKSVFEAGRGSAK